MSYNLSDQLKLEQFEVPQPSGRDDEMLFTKIKDGDDEALFNLNGNFQGVKSGRTESEDVILVAVDAETGKNIRRLEKRLNETCGLSYKTYSLLFNGIMKVKVTRREGDDEYTSRTNFTPAGIANISYDQPLAITASFGWYIDTKRECQGGFIRATSIRTAGLTRKGPIKKPTSASVQTQTVLASPIAAAE